MDRFTPASFKKAIIKEVQKYPQVWHKGTDPVDKYWDVIHKAVNLPLSRSRVRGLWFSIRRYYVDLIVSRTINRNNLMPRWEYFHDMSFLYENVKEIVKEKLGGQPVPMFVPLRRLENVKRRPCPCCLPLDVAYNNLTDIPEAECQTNDLEENEQSMMQSDNTVQEESESIRQPDEFVIIEYPEISEAIDYIDLDSDNDDDTANLENYQNNSRTQESPCLSSFTFEDNFDIEDIDKFKDYDREVLFFSESRTVICLDDD